MTTCPECGAQASAELGCQTAFNECLAKEFTDPDFGLVHHLTLATYMLQHSSKLSREGWLATRELLREFLVENKSPAEIRKRNKSMVDSGNVPAETQPIYYIQKHHAGIRDLFYHPDARLDRIKWEIAILRTA